MYESTWQGLRTRRTGWHDEDEWTRASCAVIRIQTRHDLAFNCPCSCALALPGAGVPTIVGIFPPSIFQLLVYLSSTFFPSSSLKCRRRTNPILSQGSSLHPPFSCSFPFFLLRTPLPQFLRFEVDCDREVSSLPRMVHRMHGYVEEYPREIGTNGFWQSLAAESLLR